MIQSTLDVSVPHSYPLAVRDSGVAAAIGLLMRSLPYALMRFAVLLAFSVAGIVWLVITIGGSVWAAAHIAGAFGFAWFVSCAIVAGWFWTAILRYLLHLIECGHVAVLTELIVHGRVGNGSESMFAYGKRVVTEKFGQVNALFAMNLLVRGVVNSVHATIEGIGHMLPIPGIESIGKLITAILRAATRYMDKVIFSYNLACGESNPWRSAQDGLVYYAQNAKPILKQAVWIVVLEHVLSALLWLVLLIPAAALTALLPHSVREWGGAPDGRHRRLVRAGRARRVSEADVSHHDHRALPRADRARADQSGVGGAAESDLDDVPRSGSEGPDVHNGAGSASCRTRSCRGRRRDARARGHDEQHLHDSDYDCPHLAPFRTPLLSRHQRPVSRAGRLDVRANLLPASALRRPPLPLLLHVHGLVMTGWVVLLVVQSALIAARRVRGIGASACSGPCGPHSSCSSVQ